LGKTNIKITCSDIPYVGYQRIPMKKNTCDLFSEISIQAREKMRLCKQFATQYFPDREIELLLIGESPPFGKTYFYIPDDLRQRYHGLPAKVFRSLFNADSRIDKETCEFYIKKFCNNNYLLTDLCPYPIDCFTSAFRILFIEKELNQFAKKISELDLSPSCKKLLFLPSGTYNLLHKPANAEMLDKIVKIGIDNSNIILWSAIEEHLREYSEEHNANL
jgi:hypothetical protein